MSTRLTTRRPAWMQRLIHDYAKSSHIAEIQRLSDKLAEVEYDRDRYAEAVERDAATHREVVRTLQSELATTLETIKGLRQSRTSDAEGLVSLNTQLTVEMALVDYLCLIAGESRESVNERRVAISEAYLAHPSHGEAS